jgi:hypothetical protein
MVTPDGHSNPALDCDLPASWQRMGIGLGVYVRLPSGSEPIYLAGLGRGCSLEDIRMAIKFLGVVQETLERNTPTASCPQCKCALPFHLKTCPIGEKS